MKVLTQNIFFKFIFFNEPHKYETLEEGVEDEDTGVEVKVEETENEPLQNDFGQTVWP